MTAAVPNLDMSLDDMIAAKPKGNSFRRGQGRRSGGQGRNTTIVLGGTGGGAVRNNAGRDSRRGNRPYAAIPQAAAAETGSKIIVSNLHFDVTEADLKELFGTKVGPLRKVALSFDQNGRSRGIAQVTFAAAKDATVAYQRYHNVTLDERPMKIEILVQPNATPARNLVVGPPNGRNSTQRNSGGRNGGRGRGGNNAGRRTKAPAKTEAELDAEMNAYMSGNTDAPAISADGDVAM